MYKKKEKWLSIGDVLAEDVFHRNKLIFKQGTILTFNHIFTLMNLNKKMVKVKKLPQYLLEKQEQSNKGSNVDVEADYLEEIFQEFLLTNGQNGRYRKFIRTEEDLNFLQSLFVSLLNNEVVNNLLSALKVWDFYSYIHSIDVFIIGTQWLRYLQLPVQLKEVATGFLLHDIGKIKVPQEILQKNGTLTQQQFEIIKTHVYFGEELLNKLGFTKTIKDMAMYHHTVLDGTGYPEKFFADLSLPKEINMLTIVDIFSALTLDRPYRNAFTMKEAKEILAKQRNKFDESLLNNFFGYISKRSYSTNK